MSWEHMKKKQPKIARLLINSLIYDRLSHAYLFEGPRGSGKKEMALLLAKSFFCESRKGEHPCDVCPDCKRIDSFNHPDLHIIAPDGLSIKKDQVLYLQKEFTYTGMESRKKFYIVEEADKMSAGAANSLLKFLEEPKAPTVAVLITNAKQRMLKTIVSRSQVLSFSPVSPHVFAGELERGGMSPALARLIAHLTTNMEEADKLCQEDWIAQARKVVLQLTEEVYARPEHVLLTLQHKFMPLFQGRDLLDISLDLLLYWYRDLLLIKLQQEDEIVYIDERKRLEKEALNITEEKIIKRMDAVLEAKKHVRANVNPQLLMENLVLNLQEG